MNLNCVSSCVERGTLQERPQYWNKRTDKYLKNILHSLEAKLIKILPYDTQFYAKCLKTRLRIFRLKSRFFRSLVYYCPKAEILLFESESYRPREHIVLRDNGFQKPDRKTLNA
jgi:hypothetical protein